MVFVIYGFLLSSKTRFLNICVRAVTHFTSLRIDFWYFIFKRYYNYKEYETQQGTCDKGRITGKMKARQEQRIALPAQISETCQLERQNRRESLRSLDRLIQEYFSKETPSV